MGESSRKILRTLLFIHINGVWLSFIYFSYQYMRENGFISWLFFGEIKPALKSAVWEVFLALALLQGPAQSRIIDSLTENLWWQAEYPALIEKITSSSQSSLETSYRSGPGGIGLVTLLLKMRANQGLEVTIRLPKEALVSIEPQTGERVASQTPPQIIVRDHNLDGIPDDFKIEPAGEPVYKEEMTEDGFIKYRNSVEHKPVLAQWSISIGFCINHFLHGIDSSMPRE